MEISFATNFGGRKAATTYLEPTYNKHASKTHRQHANQSQAVSQAVISCCVVKDNYSSKQHGSILRSAGKYVFNSLKLKAEAWSVKFL
jgi:hypothetical protein